MVKQINALVTNDASRVMIPLEVRNWRLRLTVIAAGLLVSILANTLSLPVRADDFPGKGNRSDWSTALPYYNLANKYMDENRFSEAAEKYEIAVSYYKFDPDFYVNLGVAYRKLENYPEAERAFKTASELSPNDWVPWSDLANVYLKQNRLQDTLSTFERTLKCNPPASEKTAIDQDISDIKKFLRMQGQPDVKAEMHTSPAPSLSVQSSARTSRHSDGNADDTGTKVIVPKAGSRANSSSTRSSGTATSNRSNAPVQRAVSKPATAAPQPATNGAGPNSQKSNDALKQSGWDYLNK